MQVINHILIYSKKEAKQVEDQDSLSKKNYVEARRIEDIAHSKQYTVFHQGQPRTVTQTFITKPGIQNREQKRAQKKANRKKGHKIDFHHKESKKRHELNKQKRRGRYR